jgi:hypothetical protein
VFTQKIAFSSFPRKLEPRDFSYLLWVPAFAGATSGMVGDLIKLQTGNPQNLDVTVDGRRARLPPAGYAGRVDAVLDAQSLLAGAEGQR